MRLPAVEARGEHGAGTVIAFAELADEVGDGATSPPAPLMLQLDEGVGPALQAGPAAETGEQGALAFEDAVVGGLGHGAEQVGLVVEVVVELAARRRGALPDIVQAGPGGSFFG